MSCLGKPCCGRWKTTEYWSFADYVWPPKPKWGSAAGPGEWDSLPAGPHPVAGIYPITLDTSKNSSAAYLRATFDWHIDGCTPVGEGCPQKATLLSAVAVAERGGETEFANSYAAYDSLSDEDKDRFGALRVVHS